MTSAERSLACFRRKSQDPAFRAARAEKARTERRRRGLQKVGPKTKLTIDRFVAKISTNQFSACWLWTGFVMENGYARLSSGGKRGPVLLAHRFSYEYFVGQIPEGQELHHSCLTKRCVNPDHLHCLSHADHMKLHAGEPL